MFNPPYKKGSCIAAMPVEEKVEMLWDLVSLFRESPEISPDDHYFFRRVAIKLQIDKSLLDLMLK